MTPTSSAGRTRFLKGRAGHMILTAIIKQFIVSIEFQFKLGDVRPAILSAKLLKPCEIIQNTSLEGLDSKPLKFQSSPCLTNAEVKRNMLSFTKKDDIYRWLISFSIRKAQPPQGKDLMRNTNNG